ncbi:MAG: hypothetical protein J0I20_04045 [Chloroflexi bacterium]|nr:hypothetical protein [Chloroflexota bacterium]OJW04281.1 MAG: hypothetical protein BGO39_10960 [Chloroflexi bacterium 54-19]
MTQDNENPTPASPETQPARVREELDQEDVTHQGTPVEPNRPGDDPQGYMGATEENVTPIMPPVTGPADITGDETPSDKNPDVNPQDELTPG